MSQYLRPLRTEPEPPIRELDLLRRRDADPVRRIAWAMVALVVALLVIALALPVMAVGATVLVRIALPTIGLFLIVAVLAAIFKPTKKPEL